jgi:UDP-N-acetylmuramyl pentapeptide synthase
MVGQTQELSGHPAWLERTLSLARTPVGRGRLLLGLIHYSWPLTGRLAGAYRRTLVRDTRVVAVVGSFGKTTTARAITAALGRRAHRRIFRNSYGFLAEAILRIRPGDGHAVIEVGIERRGRMADYARVLRPELVVVTSIGSEHNRAFKSLAVTRDEKADMLRALPGHGLAVVNGDDANVQWMATQTRARVVRFGFGLHNDVQARETRLEWPRGTTFTVLAGSQRRTVRSQLVGRQHVYAALAAIAVALEEGFDLDGIVTRLEALRPTPGRMEILPLKGGAYVLRDDRKSSIETVDAALDVMAEVPARRRFAVIGEVTEPPAGSSAIYRRLGARLAACVDRAIVVGGDFRNYKRGATRAGLPVSEIVDGGRRPARAAAELKAILGPGDVVLLKGHTNQRLERVALALAGRPVRCNIDKCHSRVWSCGDCPMLERGWDGLPVAT